MKLRKVVIIWILMASLVVACTPGTDAPATLVIPTPIVQRGNESPEPTRPANQPLPAAPTFEVTREATVAPTVTPQMVTETPVEDPQLHQVAFVVANDVLNMRDGPGVEFEIVEPLSPDATGILVTGLGQVVSSSTWVPVSLDGRTGWVNSRFLAEIVDSETFCEHPEVLALLEDFKRAVAEQDDELMARLIHPERGLRISYSWWNPQILIRQDVAEDLFSSDSEYEWGLEDGSGQPIVGSLTDTILPLLQEDLMEATEQACNDILHGGTAGLIQLPDGYGPVNFFSYFRPGTDRFAGMDWGTWVVGIEQWQDEFYLSFLVHYAWEI